ncbi:MAG: NUDIX domain-containing protein [Cellvibrionaceae bacterium]
MSLNDDDNVSGDTFSSQDVKVESREFVYTGFFKMEKLALKHRLFEGGWTDTIHRELFVRGQAVAAVMYDPFNKLIGLIEQFRVGAIGLSPSPWLCEVVAGMTEEGEEPQDVILRELQEEAAMTPQELIPICDYFSSPGGTDESLSLFCAIGDLSHLGGIHGLKEENEDIKVLVLPEKQVFDELYTGRYNNAATLICLQWLQLHRLDILSQYAESANAAT